eukprot:4979243-Prymnesium_polylepis.1
MGCCFGKNSEELPPAFDPVIGLSEKLKAPAVEVAGSVISGSGSILGDSPVLQVRAACGARRDPAPATCPVGAARLSTLGCSRTACAAENARRVRRTRPTLRPRCRRRAALRSASRHETRRSMASSRRT